MSDVFQTHILSNGEYLWSNPNNWTEGVPANGEKATISLNNGQTADDDIPSLTLTSLSLTSDGYIYVTGSSLGGGSLGVGTIVNNGGNDLQLDVYSASGASTPVTITVGSIIGGGGDYIANGQDASFVDNSPSDPGAFYGAFLGGTVLFNAVPSNASVLSYDGTGTIALENPGAEVGAGFYHVLPGDVLELPGTTLTSLSFGSDSMTIATNAGTTTFNEFYTAAFVTGYTAGIDPATGLEAITFTGQDIFTDHVSASSGSLAGDYLWSNPANWSDGVVPVNGDSVTFVGTSADISIDDLTALSLSSLTLAGSGELRVSDGSLGIGTVVNNAGDGSGISGYVTPGAATPVTITVGSITGSAGGFYSADGENVSFVDNSPTDPGADYEVYYGATVVLAATPAAGSYFEYYATGTIELENPGPVTHFLYEIGPGDVLELPGTTVTSASFAAESLTITTNAGTYAVTLSGDGSDLATGYTAQFDPSTGLEAITFTRTDTFEDNVAASSGSLAGDYLWSNGNNWTGGVPVNDDAVTVVGTNNDKSVDDLTELSLSSLTLTGKGDLYVPGGSLGIGAVVNEAGVYSGIIADDGGLDAAAPVTVTVGGIAGPGGFYEAYGPNASFVDNSPTDPGATYFPFAGGTLLLNAAPVASTFLEYLGAGTLELEHPGSLIAAALQGIEPGDVLELPGTTVSSGIFNLGPAAPSSGSFTITTNSGTYTFSNVTERSLVSAYTASFDAVTGLEAVTFAGPEIFEDNVVASSGSLAGDYLWSNPANWTGGIVPLNGDSVTFVGTNNDTSVDDLTALSLSSLTLTGKGDLYVPGGSLTIGTVVNEAGVYSGIFADEGGLDAPAPVTVTVGSITGAGGSYEAYGANASFVDNSPTDSGATYFPYGGGTEFLNAAPVASSHLEFIDAGTLELENPGTLISAAMQGIEPGEVLELPGTAVSSAVFDLESGSGSFTITTNAGTYTFSDVDYRSLVSDFTANFDSVTGLEAIIFTGPYLQDLVVPEGQTDIIFSGNTVSNPELAGGTLELDSGSTVTGNISFTGTGGALIIEPNVDGIATVPDNEITGFAPGDTIKLAGISFNGTGGPYGASGEDTYTVASAGTLTIDAAGTIYDLQIEGVTIGQHNFVLADDLQITETACYVAGTRIATAAGEVPVEDLAIGDYVETLHAGLQKVKWIGCRSYDGRFIAGNRDLLPICIKRHAIAEDVPARDLFVSPGHAICIDGALIHAFRLVNGVSITQGECVESVTYYHIELETHEIILADNCPAETFLGEDFRQQFQNAWQFSYLYPDEVAPETMCLPRLDGGFQLHAIQKRIAARAGIAMPAAHKPGPLRGYVDQAGPKICCGWVQDISAPEDPVCLDIKVDGRTIGRVLANLYRADLRAAGYGSGYHGFEFLLPPGITGRIDAVRTPDRAVLAWTETAAGQAA